MSTVSLFSVVDDDASVRAATSKFLRSHGYTVQAYSSAEHFLQSGRLNDTSCVIADLQMPGMSGLELLTMMRAHGYGAPFIFITGFPDETTRARALQAGAICFLPKPFAGPTLINCLGVALEGGGAKKTREPRRRSASYWKGCAEGVHCRAPPPRWHPPELQ